MAASHTRFTQNSLGQSKNPIDSYHGIYRDRPRVKGSFWLSACGRVQVMCPACLRGAHDRWP